MRSGHDVDGVSWWQSVPGLSLGLVDATGVAHDRPTTCSGLPIVRCTHEDLAAQLSGFGLADTAGEGHETPWGVVQPAR